MAQIIVRNLEDTVRNKLRDLAQSHGRSMEEEVREILRGSVADQSSEKIHLGSRLAQRFASHGFDNPIAELRGQAIDPPSFDE